MFDAALKLLESFQTTENKWFTPFPMGVFGTLRVHCGNTFLMGSPSDGSCPRPTRRWGHDSQGPLYESHHKAFMPHFQAYGLGVSYSPQSAAVFEVFTYKPEEWAKMIPDVDNLEGFTPRRGRDFGYHRTLAWLHILPDDYESVFFEDAWPGDPRVLPIPMSDWDKYPRIPCWVYSSLRENERSLLAELTHQPIIWFG